MSRKNAYYIAAIFFAIAAAASFVGGSTTLGIAFTALTIVSFIFGSRPATPPAV